MSKTVEQSRKYSRTHYSKHKEQYLEKNRKAKEIKRQYVLNLKTMPCTDCDKSYPHYIMEFDHIQPKYKHIGSLLGSSWKILLAELAKCELVCANCHATRTYNRRRPDEMVDMAD